MIYKNEKLSKYNWFNLGGPAKLFFKPDSQFDLEKFLKEHGIPAGIHYKPNHLLSYLSGNIKENLPAIDILYPWILTLPLHPELSFEDIATIVKLLKQGIEHVKTAPR